MYRPVSDQYLQQKFNCKSICYVSCTVQYTYNNITYNNQFLEDYALLHGVSSLDTTITGYNGCIFRFSYRYKWITLYTYVGVETLHSDRCDAINQIKSYWYAAE